ncbi:hypothetical protein OAU50_03745 [Planctomycetota bacterium]|nr:hypothetical protein [Planctomycetota bacterium]
MKEVLDAHFAIAEYFSETGEGMGGIGPREKGLLDSALAQQHAGFGGDSFWK